MELPQPRTYGAQGKPTDDFLSFYSQIQDPSPPEQGIYPKTHDFLQPLERVNKNSAYEVSTPEVKPAPSVASSSGEHVLPGGIGTYTIRNVSYFNQRILKPEKSVFTAVETIGVDNNEENSNCSSHAGRGFTLWEESAVRKGKTRKESHSHGIRGAAKIGGQWAALERPSQSCSNIATTATTTSFSSRSSSQSDRPELQKNQSFMDMLKSAKAAHDEDEDDEEEYALKKEAPSSPLKGELTVRVGSGGGKNMDQKPNTPRSKHSATEQRRRSKINDRFHMLRELIPNSDQKRDKASFLLEVIEYIQFLQEKVHKYEGTYQGWNQELPKSIPWQSSTNDVEGYVDRLPTQSNGPVPSMAFSAKFDENGINFSPTNQLNSRKTTKSDVKTRTQLTEIDHSFELTTNEEPPMQENIFRPFGNTSTVSHPQPQTWQGVPSVPDCDPACDQIKENDLTIESGVISISSVYSEGLFNTITQALQRSGVDMSQAKISVQVDLGKRTNNRVTSQDDDVRYIDRVRGSPRGANGVDKPDREQKRLRTS